MTLEEFLTKLAQTPRKWRLGLLYHRSGNETQIRCGQTDEGRCPLMEVAKVRGRASLSLGMEGADRLGLDYKDAVRIMEAADWDEPAYRDLRARLLKACGLS